MAPLALLLLVQLFSNGAAASSSCNYIQLNDGMMWFFAADVCMEYQMDNLTRSHVYHCADASTIEYQVYESSTSCSGDNYRVAMQYTSKNAFALNCRASTRNKQAQCSVDWTTHFLHGQCNGNALDADDHQHTALVTDECVRYNPGDSHATRVGAGSAGRVSASTYRSTIWSCEDTLLTQNTYLSDDCSGASNSKTYQGCTSDHYKYHASSCA